MKGRQNILHADVGKLVIRCGFKIKNRTECPHTYTTLQLLCFTLLYLQCWGSTGVPQKPHVSAATENLLLVYMAIYYIYVCIRAAAHVENKVRGCSYSRSISDSIIY